jgi:hypothetical protein
VISQEAVKQTIRELTAVHADFLDALALNIETNDQEPDDVVRELRQASEHWRESAK